MLITDEGGSSRVLGGGGQMEMLAQFENSLSPRKFPTFQKGHASGAHSGFSDGNRWPNFVPMMRMGWRRSSAEIYDFY